MYELQSLFDQAMQAYNQGIEDNPNHAKLLQVCLRVCVCVWRKSERGRERVRASQRGREGERERERER